MPVQVLEGFSIPKTAKAAVLSARDKPYEIEDKEVPQPGPGEVLVKMNVTGVCHSDTVPRHEGPMVSRIPIIGGHEGIGIVVAQGEGVKQPALGSRVGMRWDAYGCGQCDMCIQGEETACPENLKKYHGFFQDGTFQEYMIVTAAWALPIPDSISDVQAAPLMCAGVTVYKGLKVGRPLAGTWVCFPGGAGGLGHIGIQMAKAFGCKVIVIDAGEKEEFCRKLGADAFVDFTKSKDVVADVIAATNGGPHTTLVTTNASSAYLQAILYARNLGTVVFIGLAMVPSFPAVVVIGKHLTLVGSATGTRLDAKETIEFCQAHNIKVAVEERDFKDLEQTLQDLEKAKVLGRVVLKF